MKHFLILGYPRSGTSYAAVAFHKAGLYVTHERDETFTDRYLERKKVPDGVVTGLFEFCERDFGKYDVIFHQTRHPLDVITSAQRMSYKTMCDLTETCELPQEWPEDWTKLRRVMKTWLKFTELADSVANMRYQVETMRLRKNWNQMLKAIGLSYTIAFPQRINTYINTYGDKRPDQLTWQDLYECDEDLASQIMRRTVEYGYEVADKIPNQGPAALVC